MCDVFPASMAFAMQACTQYRTRVLDNGSARRLNELFEAHAEGREKRQIWQAIAASAGLYGAYKIIGDLFRGTQFVPNLLVQQIISFTQVNESEILYELQEDDFNFVVEADVDDTVGRNESLDLDSILPKIVGHARIENFFAVPANFLEKEMDLYKITRLPFLSNDGTVVVNTVLGKVVVCGRT
ncbi:unnamed protein product [Rotaria sordida]|nr:unnamed protein product [Rotaria sordida]CAF1373400.1 unnamed protein product [Rotaria sordida]CAF3830955.1 unnamed protein product [Rotaria sordida]CAF3901998.1 unnamed protein product [Rotaria sordida]CAF4142794.1 unnamed protein product [Rotaria sordida]